MDFICKSPESVLKSLSDWFNCPESDIISILKRDWETEFIKARKKADDYYYINDFDSNDDELLEHFGLFIANKGFGDYYITHKSVNIHWFHGSRVIDISSFESEGILPLTEIFPRITALIDSIAQRLGIKACEDTKSSLIKQRIEIKFGNAIDHGPCAMLMYEATIDSDNYKCHSYIDEPEIVSDYVTLKYGKSSNKITSEFKRITKPVVIEFIETRDCKDSSVMDVVIIAALTYMYEVLHNEEKSLDANIGHSEYGKKVSPDRIVDITVL